MALWRGFKSYANELARRMRQELGVGLHAPLNPWRLATHLEIPITKLSELGIAEANQFLIVDPGAFSAVTVFCGRRRTIVHNDAHDLGRQASDLAHELSHGLLMHEPGPAFGFLGCRNWNGDQEDEANWLGPALLISDEAAIHIVQAQMTPSQAATRYGVSEQLVRMRVNVTGARKRVSRHPLSKASAMIPPSQHRKPGRK